jgi:hypothetical protein
MSAPFRATSASPIGQFESPPGASRATESCKQYSSSGAAGTLVVGIGHFGATPSPLRVVAGVVHATGRRLKRSCLDRSCFALQQRRPVGRVAASGGSDGCGQDVRG